MSRETYYKSRIIFLGLICLAFILRFIYFKQTIGFIQPGCGSDAYFYLQWARDIVRGNVLGKDIFYALPLYPYFLSLVYLFSGGEISGLILVQIFIGSLNCGLIYILAKRLFNDGVGIIASVFACGYAMFIFYDRVLLPASLGILLGLLLALSLLTLRQRPSLKGWFATGILLGLCTLTRASFVLLAFFVIFWIIHEFRGKSQKQVFLYCLSFALAFVLVAAAVALRNYLATGDTVLATAHSGINFYIGNNPQANGLFKAPPLMRATQSGLIEDSRIVAESVSGRRLKASTASNFWFNRAFSFIRTYPLSYLKLLGRKLTLFWNGKEHIDDVEYYLYNEKTNILKFPLFRFSLICPLAILGIFLSRPRAKKISILYFFTLSIMLSTIFFFVNSRYRLIAVPYLIIFAAFAFWRILEVFRNKQYKKLISILALFFTLYFLININPGSASSSLNLTLHYNKGVCLFEQADYLNAKKEFQAAIKLDSFDFMSYFSLGNAYYKMNDFQRAINNYKEALSINPIFYKAYFNLGIIYKEMGKTEEAESAFKKVLEFNPGDCPTHYNLGKIYQEKGLTAAALKEYRQALTIEPNHEEITQAIKEIKESVVYEK